MDETTNINMDSLNQAAANIANVSGMLAGIADSEEARRFSKEMYEQSLADQREDVNMSREYAEMIYNTYQSPSALYDQYRAIGMNPNDITAGLLRSGSSPQVQGAQSAPSVSAPTPTGIGASISNFAQNLQSMRLQQQTLANMEAEQEKVKAETQRTNLENKYVEKEKTLTLDEARSRIAKNSAEVDKAIADMHLTSSQEKQVRELTPLLLTKTTAEIDNIKQATAKYIEDVKTAYYERSLLVEQAETYRKQQEKLGEESELVRRQQMTEESRSNLSEVEYQIATWDRRVKEIRSKFEGTLLENGILPEKIDYSLKSPIGNALMLYELLNNAPSKNMSPIIPH